VIVSMDSNRERASRSASQGGDRTPARLVSVRRDGSDGEVFTLVDPVVDVGREECEVCFPDDLYLAQLHARIERRPEGCLLWPVERRNGVYLRVREPVELAHLDHLLIGRQVLRFELLQDLEINVPPQVMQGVFLFGTPVRTPWGRIAQITTTGVPRDVYHLQRDEILIGREGADFTFPDDEFVSRRHLALRRVTEGTESRPIAEDLGSSNGTFLRVREPTALKNGDLLRLGDQLLRFELG
jgi:pSer/pThr/pTyr-binding forkhead associated (FHA) protein